MVNPNIFIAIEHMAQGLAYWMGYRQERYASHRMKECVAVEEAVGLLSVHLDSTKYKILCEEPYTNISPGLVSKEFADIAIEEKGKGVICVIEFKEADTGINAINSDISKLRKITPIAVDKYEIVMFLRASRNVYINIINGTKIRRSITIKAGKVIGRRLCKAWESGHSKYPSVAILEVK